LFYERKILKSLTFEQIQEMWAMPFTPNRKASVEIPSSVLLYESPTAPNFLQKGGGWQVYINSEADSRWFTEI
jgi:hypothetical protein